MRSNAAIGSACAAALALLLCRCSPGDAGQAPQPAVPVAKNTTLTPDQRQHITLYTVAPSNYMRTVETTGAVDFDGDQSTSVLAPISGPVSRLLVSVGQRVKKGDPLALVESPDYATAVSTYQKALATAQTARRVADFDKDLFAHQGVPQR